MKSNNIKYIKLLVFVFFHTFICTTFSALAKPAAQPNPADLIGQEITGVSYPNGWVMVASDGYGKSPYIFSVLKNKKQYAILLKKKINKSKTGERTKSLVTDALLVADPTNYHKFSHVCYFSEKNKREGESIYAEVGFARFCDMETKAIKRAWRVNLETGHFDQLPSTKNLSCGFGYVAAGEPDFRENCPTYSWIKPTLR
jgi:hypothetical protein